jgi:ATP-dependent helicase HrpB
MSELPIYELKEPMLAQLRASNRLILQAPTGSGKSTQVPQILLDGGIADDGEIVVLQPRRLATRMLAARVAQERKSRLGGEVGYQIRLDKVTSKETRIRFVTEGVLLRQLLADPQLRGISVVIFDEFHERHLYGDITLARALDLQEKARPDLKIVVMSATLDTARLDGYLAPCVTLQSQGRTFPVEIEYLDKPAHFDQYPVWELAADELNRIAPKTEGDVLIFMPGAYEIARTVSAVQALRHDFVVLPLHGELSPDLQDAAVARYEKRKVVVATNVAETSLTIDGVRVVIDGGIAKIARFDPHRGINTLLVEKISRASSDQRAGRAGRTAPGRCLRLWTEREHLDRAPQELPEVKRLDLAEVVLTLKASGVNDVAAFRWLEPPDAIALERAESLLHDLGALEPKGEISKIGRRMLAFPMHPRYARMLLAADELGCVRPVALVAALTQGRGLLQRAQGKQMEQDREDFLGEKAESDFFLMMRAYRFAEKNNFNPNPCRKLGIHALAAREAGALFEQFLKIAKDEKLDTEHEAVTDEAIQRCVLAGFSDQLARRRDSGTLHCDLVHARRGVLARESVVQHAPLFVASEVREVAIKGEVQTLLTLATAVEEPWLREMFPGDFSIEETAIWDTMQRRVMARRETKFRDLVLSAAQSDKASPEAAARILAELVIAGKCPLTNWDNAVEQWIIRLNRLREWMPELELPALGDDDRQALIEQICYGAASYREIKERAVWPVVKTWLSSSQQGMLDKLAPERIELPNGKRWKIQYDAKAAPTVAARIQELYGVEGSLTIAAGRVPLVIQVLAPNHRPIQVTQNLSTFWKESYPKLKLELQRKYPRHEWR